MKNLVRMLVGVLTIGAAAQAVMAYADNEEKREPAQGAEKEQSERRGGSEGHSSEGDKLKEFLGNLLDNASARGEPGP